MKNTMLKTIGTTALAILMMAAFAQISVFAQEDITTEDKPDEQTQEDASMRRANARLLEGVWNTVITRLNCQTGAVIGTAPAILTFTRGGTMSDAGTQIAPSLRGPGHGVWSYESMRHYTTAFQFFRFNADGTLAGKQIVRQQIQLSRSGNNFTSAATAQVLDAGGNVIATNCSTATGTRFE